MDQERDGWHSFFFQNCLKSCQIFCFHSQSNHLISHVFPQQMQNGISPPHKTTEKSCECHFSPIFNLLWISRTPSLSPCLFTCQTPRPGHHTRFWCSSNCGRGHQRMRLWNQVGTTKWRCPISLDSGQDYLGGSALYPLMPREEIEIYHQSRKGR